MSAIEDIKEAIERMGGKLYDFNDPAQKEEYRKELEKRRAEIKEEKRKACEAYYNSKCGICGARIRNCCC